MNLLNIKDLKTILSLKESKIRSLIFKKEIPYLKIGNLIRFEEQEINNWIKSKKKGVSND